MGKVDKRKTKRNPNKRKTKNKRNTSRKTSRKTKSKTIIPVKLKKGELGKYGYRNIKELSPRKRHAALKKAVEYDGYLPILRRLVVIRTFNKNREHLYEIYNEDVKWLQKNRERLDDDMPSSPKKKRNVKTVKVKKRGGSKLIITQSDSPKRKSSYTKRKRNRRSRKRNYSKSRRKRSSSKKKRNRRTKKRSSTKRRKSNRRKRSYTKSSKKSRKRRTSTKKRRR